MRQYLFALLRAAINETMPLVPPADLDWEELFEVAKRHSVACTAYYGVAKLPKDRQPSEEILGKFKKEMQLVLGRETMQHYEIQNMLDELEKHQIRYVPMKGWRMKNLYPRPDMRSMCDVDVLVDSDNLSEVKNVLIPIGFQLEEHGANHDEYLKLPHITTEIHWTLFPEISPYYEYFLDYMDRVKAVEGSEYHYEMGNEDFYLHLIAHLAKHFAEGGGTGIRSFMDIYIYNKVYGDTLDQTYLKKELEKLNLEEFAVIIKELAFAWFAEGLTLEEREKYPEITEFVLNNGMYGTKEAGVVSKMGADAQKSKGKYLLRRFFPPLSFLKGQFRVLEKAPWLLPVFWGVRAVRSVTTHRDRFAAEMKIVKNTDSEAVEKVQQIMRMSGIK